MKQRSSWPNTKRNAQQLMYVLASYDYSVRTGFGKFWKVMEIENVIVHYMECFGKERIFKMAMEKFLIFVWKNSKNIPK